MENTKKEIEEKIKRRKEKIKNWLKDPYNLAFLGIMIFAIAIRFYYFWLTKNQPLWWDEAVYGVLAKSFITDMWRNHGLVLHELSIRSPILPLAWAILMFFKISEAGARFTLEVVPSILSVLFVYLISKEIFNKKIAIISTLIFSIIWNYLFFSIRFLPDVPATFFLLASIYFFIISIKNDFIPKHFFVSIFLMSLSTLTRYNNGIFFLVYLFILMPTKKFYYKDKNFWFSGLFGLIPLFIFFFVNFIMYGNIFQALLGGYIKPEVYQQTPIGWWMLGFVKAYLGTTFLIFFILGSILILFTLLISYNIILKKPEFQEYLLLILIFLSLYSFFIFFIRGAEDRYFLPTGVVVASFAGFGVFQFYNFIKKYSKIIAIILLVSILSFGVYTQIKQADQIINIKKESFLQIKQGVEWLKQNTPENSIIAGAGLDPYSIYYSDIDITYYNETQIDNLKKVDYVVIHAFPPETYLTEYIQNHTDTWVPVQAFFFDSQRTQPALIIYKQI